MPNIPEFIAGKNKKGSQVFKTFRIVLKVGKEGLAFGSSMLVLAIVERGVIEGFSMKKTSQIKGLRKTLLNLYWSGPPCCCD